jgi:hypothetical protein
MSVPPCEFQTRNFSLSHSESTGVFQMGSSAFSMGDDSVQKRLFMLRQAQHERKIVNVISVFPFALSSSKGEPEDF